MPASALASGLVQSWCWWFRYSYLKMTVEPAAAAAGNEAAQPLIGGDKDVDLSSADVSLPAKHLPSAASLTGSGHAQLSARFPSVDAKH